MMMMITERGKLKAMAIYEFFYFKDERLFQ